MRLATMMIAAALTLAANAAAASQCPTLIKQAREELAKFKSGPGLQAIKDAKIAAVETNLQAAEAAHGAGQHDEAVKQAKEALKALGK